MKNITFSKLFKYYLIFYVVTFFINGFTVKNYLLANICRASLGFYLLINPVYPLGFEYNYGKEKAKKYIRIIAVILIIVSFAVRTNF